jgi:multidrug efflux pump subunit AcrA (membrane-fusion protein)
MSEEMENVPRTYSGALLAAIAVALVAALGGLIWCYTLGSRLTTQQSELAEAKQHNGQLQAKLRETDARLEVATDELKTSLGLTQKQLDSRAQEIADREQKVEASAQRLASAQKQTAQQVTAVTSAVSDVKTDVGGVKTDVAKTQTDLATTISQLQSIKGDLSSTNSIIARNHDELVLLEHKGDRNYYEFTLTKGQKKPVGTVSLELKKTDPKRSKFTLDIYADDKTYDKKDRNVNEPLQFYSGKDPALFEIVVNSISAKNQISGYLTTPKTAPVPPTAQ